MSKPSSAEQIVGHPFYRKPSFINVLLASKPAPDSHANAECVSNDGRGCNA